MFAMKLSRNVVAFRILLRLLPLVLILARAHQRLAHFAYSAYTMLPPELTAQGARAAHRTARALRKRPAEAALHLAMAYRFELDDGKFLDLWTTRVDELLTKCDEALESDVAADLLTESLWVLFHPRIHQGLNPSPFVEQSELTGRLLAHPCLMRLRRTASAARQASRHPSSEPLRTLVLTDTNFNFMGLAIEHWRQDPTLELRVRDLRTEGVDREWWSLKNCVSDRLQGVSPEAPIFLRKDLEWADVVYVEWNEALAARLSGVQMRARLVVRLHRYEAFTQTPTLTDWDNVDTLIVITPYMRELMRRTLPGVAERTSIQLCPNVIDLQRFERPKHPGAERNIALIQWASIVKDPIWALEVLRLLHQEDPTWTLLLIGSDGRSAQMDEATKHYLDRFDREAESFGDSVRRLGHQQNLPEALRSANVVLSSSQIEGAPVSLQEAIASGALPVVRNWPAVRAINGAGSLYPSEWIVDSPAEAAQRILKLANTPPSELDDRSPISWTARRFEPSAILQQLDQAVFGS